MGTAPYTPGGLSNSKLKMANATPEDVLSGKKFYSGDKTLKTGNLALTGNAGAGQVKSGYTFYNNNAKNRITGTWVPSLRLINQASVTVISGPRLSVTVSGYSEYYCYHSDNNTVPAALSWSTTEGRFEGYTSTANGVYKKLVGCNPNHNVTIGTFFNHDTGGYQRTMQIWAIG